MFPKTFIRALWLLIAVASAFALTACWLDVVPKSRTTELNGVRLTLTLPRSHYSAGDEIVLYAQWQNITNTTVILSGGDEPAFDIRYAVTDTLLWSQQHPDLAITQVELKPGESVNAEVRFVAPNKNTSYTFTGLWRIWDGVAGNSVNISVIVGLLDGE